jgi:3-hydroxyisobutyrate dehydrogenase-like beta-hydroxyacid dehydrogenase
MRAAVLGLGEAGRLYARDLARAGWSVTGYDPAEVGTPDGVTRFASATGAVRGAVLVLVLTRCRAAVHTAERVADHLAPGACYADLNTCPPEIKRDVERALGGCDARMADVAVLAPVPRAGAATPLAACGPGAEELADHLGRLGAPVEVLAGPVGTAARRKLLRSVFMKGLAAVVLETLEAGAAAGCEDWLRAQIEQELAHAGPDLVARLVEGSRVHAARRVEEMRAAIDEITGLGAPTDVCRAAEAWLDRLR